MSHVNELCHRRTSHVKWRMRYVTHWNEFCHRCEWVMSQIWPCHIPHINTSCKYEQVLTYSWHVTSPLEISRATYEWVMSQIWPGHIPHIKTSCKYERVLTYSWHVTSPLQISRATYERVMSRICTSHVTYTNESCHTSIYTRSIYVYIWKCVYMLVWHDSLVYVTTFHGKSGFS